VLTYDLKLMFSQFHSVNTEALTELRNSFYTSIRITLIDNTSEFNVTYPDSRYASYSVLVWLQIAVFMVVVKFIIGVVFLV
jgi:hypothetical protein